MQIWNSKKLIYPAVIISFSALLLLYVAEYRYMSKTSDLTEDEKAVLIMIQHLDKFQLALGDIQYSEKPFLIFRLQDNLNEYTTACSRAAKQLDSLKQLCGNGYIPCSHIFELDSLFKQNLLLTDSVFYLSKRGKLDRAAQLVHDRAHDFVRGALIRKYNEISGYGRETLQLFHTSYDEQSKRRYTLLGLVIIETILFIGFVWWRLSVQTSIKDRRLAQYMSFEKLNDGFIVTDLHFIITHANKAAGVLIDVEDVKLNGMSLFDLLSDKEDGNDKKTMLDKFTRKELNSFDFLHQQTGKWLRVNSFPSPEGYSFHVKDVSGLHQANEETRKSKRLYEFISKTNDLILHAKDEDAIYSEISNIAVRSGHFLFAWIGKPDAATKTVRPVYQTGAGDGYLDAITISTEDTPAGNGPTGKAFRNGKYYYCNDIANDPAMVSWRDEALKRGFRSSIALPVKVEEKAVAIITVYAPLPFFFTNEEVQLMLAVAENISYALAALNIDKKRKVAETRLLTVTRAIEQSSASVVITDLNGNIEYVNPAFTKLTGYTHSEVIGQNPRVLKTGHTPLIEYKHLWENITSLKEWSGEFLNKKKNGEKYWEYAVISPVVNDRGEIINFVAVKENITEKKKLEEEQKRLLAIFENSSAYVVIFDLNRNFTYANKAVREALEIGDDDITKYNVTDFRGQMAVAITGEVVKNLAETGKWTGESTYKTKSGKEIPVLQVFIAHKNENGETVYVSSTGIDITRAKEGEKELFRVNNELREFSRHLQYVRETEKNRIAKEVHDELGQGLTAIKFDVSWIKKHLSDDKAVVEQKIDELLLSISEKLTAFRRIYVSANTTMLEEIGLNASIEYLINHFSKSSYIPIRFTSNVESGQVSSSVSLALYRILEEALANVMRYSDATNVAVDLLKENDILTLHIEDNGHGFDIAQVDTKLHHGILEMRERAYAMNGKFEISSVIKKGTSIIIQVPLQKL